MTDEDQAEPRGALTIRTVAMPADTNPSGDIFGGWVMSQMDIAGGIASTERARGRTVTVAVEAMTFIAVAIEAWVRRGRIGDRVKVTAGHFVYVALGEDGKKRVVPAL